MPERGVRGNTVFSSDIPKIQIQVDESFRYVGNLKFTLMDVAWVDIYYFVDADGADLKRTFHVQFEGYLPDNTHSYHYPSKERVKLGGHDYIFDAIFWSPGAAVQERPNSDTAHGHRFLQEKGYNVGGMRDVMRERYVRLLDEARRNEILLIYAENLAQYGLTAADLAVGGKSAQEWPRLREEMHQRSRASFKVVDQEFPRHEAAGGWLIYVW